MHKMSQIQKCQIGTSRNAKLAATEMPKWQTNYYAGNNNQETKMQIKMFEKRFQYN